MRSRFNDLYAFSYVKPIAVLLAVAMLALSKLPSMYCSLRRGQVLVAYVSASQDLRDETDITQTAKALREIRRIALDADEMFKSCSPTLSIARLQGDIYFALGELDQSRAWYSRSRQLDSGNPITLFRIGNLLEKMGQLDKAIEMWSSAGAAPYFYKSGLRSLEAGDARKAYQLLRLTREIGLSYYESADLHIALSRAADALGLKAQAEQELVGGIAQESNPEMLGKLYAYLGDLYAAEERWQDALRSYREAVMWAPDKAAWRLRLAEAYRRDRQFQRAEDELMIALKLQSNSIPEYKSDVYMGLGTLYLTECHWEKAAWAFENVLLLTPDNLSASLYLGKAYRLLERSDEARPLLERALQSQHTHIVNWAQEELNKLDGHPDAETEARCESIRQQFDNEKQE